MADKMPAVVPSNVWRSGRYAIPREAPKLADVLTQVGAFLDELGYTDTLDALRAEAREDDIELRVKTWKGFSYPRHMLYNCASLVEFWDHCMDSRMVPTLAGMAPSEDDSIDGESKETQQEEGVATVEVKTENDADDGPARDSESKIDVEPAANAGSKRKRASSSSSSGSSSSSSSSDSDSVSDSDASAKVGQKRKRSASSSSSADSSSDSGSDSASVAKDKDSTASSSDSSSESSSDESDARPLKKRAKPSPVKKTASSSSDNDTDSSDSDSEAENAEAAEKASMKSSSSSSESDSDSDSDSDSSSDEAPPSPSPKKRTKVTNGPTSDAITKPKPSGQRSGSATSSSATLGADSDHEKAKKVGTLLVPDESNGDIHPDRLTRIPATKENVKHLKRDHVPFQRVPTDTKVESKFSSNAYIPYDYAERAHRDLIVTKGKGFTKEKNKKKRAHFDPMPEDLFDHNPFGFEDDTFDFMSGCGFNLTNNSWSF